MPLNSIMEISELRVRPVFGIIKPFAEALQGHEIVGRSMWILEFKKHNSKKWEELKNTFDTRSEAYKFIADVYEQIEAEELRQAAESEAKNE